MDTFAGKRIFLKIGSFYVKYKIYGLRKFETIKT